MPEKICVFADRCKIEDCNDCTEDILEEFRDIEILNNAKVGDEIEIGGVKIRVIDVRYAGWACSYCYFFSNSKICWKIQCMGKIFIKVNN